MSRDTKENGKDDDTFNITFLRIRMRNTNTVNIAFSERSHLVNGFKRDRSTLSKEKRAKELRIQ